jgi:hypothetical protein
MMAPRPTTRDMVCLAVMVVGGAFLLVLLSVQL